MVGARVALAALVLATAGFAGCLGFGEGGSATEAPTPASGEVALDNPNDTSLSPLAQLTAGDEVEGPTALPVGRWFATELTSWDGLRWDLVVAEETTEGVLLAPSNPQVAALEAQWEWVGIGHHDPFTLTETIATGAFDYFSWPLYDGATWSSTWGLGDGGVRMDHVATFVERIETGNGVFPGYEVRATTDDGTVWLYDYIPAMGWMSRIGILDDAGEYLWCICVDDWGDDHEGTYYVGRGEQIAGEEHEVELAPDDVGLRPNPVMRFDVDATADTLFIAAGAGAQTGATHAVLTDPNGDEREFQTVNAAVDDPTWVFFEDFVDVVGGTWEMQVAGASLDTEAWVYAWQTYLEERSL